MYSFHVGFSCWPKTNPETASANRPIDMTLAFMLTSLASDWKHSPDPTIDCCNQAITLKTPVARSMSVMAIYRQLTRLPSSWRLGLLPVCRPTAQNRRIRVQCTTKAIITPTHGSNCWYKTRPL